MLLRDSSNQGLCYQGSDGWNLYDSDSDNRCKTTEAQHIFLIECTTMGSTFYKDEICVTIVPLRVTPCYKGK